jgi:hypothetical protein
MSVGMNPLDNNSLDYTEFVKSNQLDNNSLLYIVSLNYIRSDNNSRLCMSKASRTLNQLDKIVRQYTGRVLQGLNSNIQPDTKFVKSNQLDNSFRVYTLPVLLVLRNNFRLYIDSEKMNQLGNSFRLCKEWVSLSEEGSNFQQYIVLETLVLYNSTRQHNQLRLYGKALYIVTQVNTLFRSLRSDNNNQVYTLLMYNQYLDYPIRNQTPVLPSIAVETSNQLDSNIHLYTLLGSQVSNSNSRLCTASVKLNQSDNNNQMYTLFGSRVFHSNNQPYRLSTLLNLMDNNYQVDKAMNYKLFLVLFLLNRS